MVIGQVSGHRWLYHSQGRGGQWTHQTGQDKKLTDQQKARHRGEMGQREDRWMEEWREEIKARSCQQTGDLC